MDLPSNQLAALEHVSAKPSPFEYKGCHMDYFVQHVLSMYVFRVVSDIKQAPWNSVVYSKLYERLQQS